MYVISLEGRGDFTEGRDAARRFLSANKTDTSFKNLGEILIYGLISLGVEEKVEVIDLGSSELENRINHKLMYFKSRYSNDIGNKITWIKSLDTKNPLSF